MARRFPFDPPLQVEEFESTIFGKALLAGRMVVTAVSPEDGQHFTIRFSCKAPPEGRGRWQVVPFAQARRIFIDVPSADLSLGDNVGDYNRHTSILWATNEDMRRVNAARYALLVAAGRVKGEKLLLSTNCIRCGRPLTDPVSIERNVGPECYGVLTGSQHEVKTPGAAADEWGIEQAPALALAHSADAPEDDVFDFDAEQAERRMQQMEAEGDREQTLREETAKAEFKAAVEDGFVTLDPGADPRSLL